MKIILVFNPKSGSALSKSELKQKCKSADIEVEKFIAIEDGFEKKLQKYLKQKTYIATIGGDGTISAVAGIVQDTKAILIPLPGGTLNHFTKDLGIPQDADAALGRLKKLKPRKIDIASVNDKFFVNNSSIGLYPTTLKARDNMESKIGKWPAAAWASLKAFSQFKVYNIELDGEQIRTPFVFIGNNHYAIDNLGITDRTRLDEGELTVYAATTSSRAELFKIGLQALFGKASTSDKFEVFHPKSIIIKTKKSAISVSYDGEMSKLKPPLKYQINPKKLTILG